MNWFLSNSTGSDFEIPRVTPSFKSRPHKPPPFRSLKEKENPSPWTIAGLNDIIYYHQPWISANLSPTQITQTFHCFKRWIGKFLRRWVFSITWTQQQSRHLSPLLRGFPLQPWRMGDFPRIMMGSLLDSPNKFDGIKNLYKFFLRIKNLVFLFFHHVSYGNSNGHKTSKFQKAYGA